MFKRNLSFHCRSLSLAALPLLFLGLGRQLPAQDIEIADELFVDLDANDPSAGEDLWESQGTLGNFVKVGGPFLDESIRPELGLTRAVTFNDGTSGAVVDAYESEVEAPPGIIGVDCTRSIEVWAFNPDIVSEETLVAWGKRGGPNGTNMAFNYGNHVLFSAVGHWGGEFPDLGWGAVPPASEWHHLVYTYDGDTTRVYQDGFISNAEYLGPGIINTAGGTKIALACQYLPDGVSLDFGPRVGALSLGKVRIHDGVLSPEQILNNYFIERPRFPLDPSAPLILNAPDQDSIDTGTASYSLQLRTSGFPLPTFELVEPAGAAVSRLGLLSYAVPKPEPDTFKVTVRARNDSGLAEASWTVTVLKHTTIQTAGELFVDLDARDPTAGTPSWDNHGTLSAFVEVGDPVALTIDSAPAVSFNEGAAPGDAYQSVEDAPDGLIGPDPTRSIEVWAYNRSLSDEEGMVAWGMRGGPDGTCMSFNFSAHPWFGAVTHWGGSDQDLGWVPNVPPVLQWNYLVYTYDGQTTRVYLNGALAAYEGLGLGQINTAPLSKITVGAQVMAGGAGPDFTPAPAAPTWGTLSIGRVRVHDGVLTPAQIKNNYAIERPFYPLPPTAAFTATPEVGEDPQEVTLDASTSISPNGAIIEYIWDLGDGEIGAGKVLKHIYKDPGRYTIGLTIKDERTAQASTSKLITVNFREESIAPWTSADIGAPLARGGARPAAGACIELYAGGRDIGSTSDQFHFIYQQLSGDSSVVARVQAATMPTSAKLGVMIREDATPGSRQASICIQNVGAGRYTFLRREAAGAPAKAPKNSTEPYTLPNAWVRIQRQGADLIGSWSTDGSTWTELSRVTMANLPDKVLGGVAAAAADTQSKYLALRATVCDLSVVGGVPPPAAPSGLKATVGDKQVSLDWNDNAEVGVRYNVHHGSSTGGPYTKLNAAPLVTSDYTDTGLTNGTTYYYVVTAVSPAGESARSLEVAAKPGAIDGIIFRRGDLDVSGTIDVSDAVKLLNYLFLGGPKPECLDAADFDNSNVADISDAVANLSYQFLGGAGPAAPGAQNCGADPTPDALGCDTVCRG